MRLDPPSDLPENAPPELQRLHTLAQQHRERAKIFTDVAREVSWEAKRHLVEYERALVEMRQGKLF